MTEERLGFVGIVIEDRQSVPKVNEILSSFAAMIEGRMGVPSPSRGQSVICLIVRGTNDQLGATDRQDGQSSRRTGQECSGAVQTQSYQ